MQGTETWHFIDGGKTVGVNPRGRFKADTGTALAAAAVAGVGIANLPDFLTDQYVASGALVPVMTRFPFAEAESSLCARREHTRRARYEC
jgi:DNA-binding transcriptional LysR family regulator